MPHKTPAVVLAFPPAKAASSAAVDEAKKFLDHLDNGVAQGDVVGFAGVFRRRDGTIAEFSTTNCGPTAADRDNPVIEALRSLILKLM